MQQSGDWNTRGYPLGVQSKTGEIARFYVLLHQINSLSYVSSLRHWRTDQSESFFSSDCTSHWLIAGLIIQPSIYLPYPFLCDSTSNPGFPISNRAILLIYTRPIWFKFPRIFFGCFSVCILFRKFLVFFTVPAC